MLPFGPFWKKNYLVVFDKINYEKQAESALVELVGIQISRVKPTACSGKQIFELTFLSF